MASHVILACYCDRTASAPLVEQLGSIDGLSLQLFLWSGNVWTPIHDHTSWGICLCLEGRLIEDRYERLDEQSQPDRAHLRHMWRATWRSGEHSSLLPYAGGIHRVGNPTAERAVTLHVYGPRLSAIDGRDYDPQRDLVCDRPIERLEPIAA